MLSKDRKITLKPRLFIQYGALLIAASILIMFLLIKPIIGVANNGDFERIMGATGLEFLSNEPLDKYFGYIHSTYQSHGLWGTLGGYFSTQISLVILAKLISWLFIPNHLFDIRFLSLIYICIFLTAFYMVLRYSVTTSKITKIFLSIACLCIFLDAGYITYFNSLYGEALSFVSLLLAFSIAILFIRKEKPSLGALCIYFIAAAFLTGAKAQNAPLGILLVAFGIRLSLLFKNKKHLYIAFFSAILILTLSGVSYLSIPKEIRVCNRYQSVFYGILKDSPTPQADLEELGLHPSMAVLANTNYFMDQYPIDIKNPAFLEVIYQQIQPPKVAHFYLKHPHRLLEKLEASAQNGFKLLQGFGSFEKSEGFSYGAVTRSFKPWSDFKDQYLPHSLLFISLFFSVYLITLVWLRSKSSTTRSRLFYENCILISLMGIIQFIIPIIGDGEADLSKHLFLFNVCFDIMFCVLLTLLFYKVTYAFHHRIHTLQARHVLRKKTVQ